MPVFWRCSPLRLRWRLRKRAQQTGQSSTGSNDRAGYNLYESAIGRGNVSAIKTFWRRSLARDGGRSGDRERCPVRRLFRGCARDVRRLERGTPRSVPTGTAVSTPGVANGIRLHGHGRRDRRRVRRPNGATLWSATTGRFILSSPAIADGVVYIGSVDASLYAFDAQTGATLWARTTGAAVISSPAVVNGVVYVGSNDDRLYAFDAQTGSTLLDRSDLRQDRLDACGRERGRVRRLRTMCCSRSMPGRE